MRCTTVLLDRSLSTAVLRLRLRFTNQLLGIGLGAFGSNRPVNVTTWGLHDRKQSIAAIIECVASHYWRIMVPIEFLRPTRVVKIAQYLRKSMDQRDVMPTFAGMMSL